MAKYQVEFKHIEETTYTGWVEADSKEEAYKMVKDEPFDINKLEEINIQGLEVIDIHVEKEQSND